MTQEEIEALMGNDDAFLTEVEVDYGNKEFEDLVISHRKTSASDIFDDLLGTGNNPQEIFDHYKRVLKAGVIQLKKERDQVVELQKLVKKLDKVMKENPEILI
jgi:hypothetical protein